MSGVGEYEVESIQRAKIVSTRGKKDWSYFVKWKNYGLDDNTWEPPSSFTGGSEHFIQSFWERIDVGGRDWTKPSQFTVKEEFFPMGPPRKPKSKKQKGKAKEPSPTLVPADSESEVRSLIEDDSNGHTEVVTHGSTPSGSKRKRSRQTREQPTEDAAESPRERKVSRRRSAPDVAAASRARSRKESSTQSISVNRIPRSPARKSSKRSKASQRESSPDEMLLRPGTSERDKDTHSDAVAAAVVEMALGNAEVPSSPDGSLFGEERAELERDELMDEGMGFGVPILLNPGAIAGAESPADGADPSPPVPAHRARAANPKIKMIEEPMLGDSSSSVIPVKAKLMKRGESSNDSGRAVAGPSKSIETSGRNSRASRSKPGPGRSSSGLQMSSLLTFQKGSLTTVKGKGRRPNDADKSSAAMEIEAELEGGSELTLGDGYVIQVSKRSVGIETVDVGQDAPIRPTGEELLQMAGLDAADAGALPDFEDDVDAHGEPDPDAQPLEGVSQANGTVSGNHHLPETSPVVQTAVISPAEKVVAKGKEAGEEVKDAAVAEMEMNGNEPREKLRQQNNSKPATEDKPVTGIHFPAWKLSTIFGPLGLGRDRPAAPKEEASISSTSDRPKPVLFLSLDSAVSLPVLLKDVHPQATPLTMLNDKPTAGPPGKFYKEEHARTLLDTMKADGFSARLVLDSTADEMHKQHFERFRSRLQAGELFVEMVGVALLAMCSSEDQILGKKLQMPTDLQGLGDSVLVAQVAIENYSAYADAVIHADDIRWSA